MSVEEQKAQAFVSRLLQNPTLNGLSPLQKEEQIIQFLQVNAAQLAPTLASAQFFPGKNWNQIFAFLVSALYRTINSSVQADLDRLLSGGIDFTFLQLLRQQKIEAGTVAGAIRPLLWELIQKPDTRRAFTGPFAAIQYHVSDRYIAEIFARKSYIHFELTKVQRLRMGKDEVRNFVDLTMLLRPLISVVASSPSPGMERASGTVQPEFADKAVAILKQRMKVLPESVVKSAVDASISFVDNHFIEATSRLAAVFTALGKQIQPSLKVDRGADTPDKSWFNVARRNYRFYGFDIKMLDELYKTAAENFW